MSNLVRFSGQIVIWNWTTYLSYYENIITKQAIGGQFVKNIQQLDFKERKLLLSVINEKIKVQYNIAV